MQACESDHIFTAVLLGPTTNSYAATLDNLIQDTVSSAVIARSCHALIRIFDEVLELARRQAERESHDPAAIRLLPASVQASARNTIPSPGANAFKGHHLPSRGNFKRS